MKPTQSEGSIVEDRCLSVVMPCYNEEATIKVVIDRVLDSPFTREVVVVDDGSTDASVEIVRSINDPRVKLFQQPFNQGKGAALRRGFKEATSPLVIVQDADLEYDPADYEEVLRPLLDDKADVVYGSRFHTSRPHRVLYYWHSLGNKVLTTASNMFTNLNITDMETCYKAFRREVIQSVEIEEDRFGFEPEITAKLARAGWRIYEVGISYAGRTYAEGKKIGWRDGVRAMYCIMRYSRVAARFVEPVGARPNAFDEADQELAEVLHSLGEAENYTDWIHGLMKPHLGHRVLEIGSGHGFLTDRLVAEGHDVVATDLSDRCVGVLRDRYAGRPNVEVRKADLSAAAASGPYDSIVLVNVLEHIEDDVAALEELAGALRPGGTLLLWVPAFELLYSDFDRRIGHFRRYRRRQLDHRAIDAGLQPVDSQYVNALGAPAWWLVAKKLRRTPTEGKYVRFYDKAVIPVLRRFESGRRVPVGQSVFGAYRKPE